MKDITIIVNSENNQIFRNNDSLGITSENLQGKIIFKPEPFVDGVCRMYIEGRGSILMQKEENCYTIDILSSLLVNESLDVCFKITEPENEKGIPIFCSKKIYFKVDETIETAGDIPEDYPSWEQILDSKIAELEELEEDFEEAETERNANVQQAINDMEAATQGVENLNIDVSDKVDGDVSVTLTKKNGITKTVVLSDGTSLMFHWEGTRLGIKTDKDTEYVYVDLKGAKGDTGPQGEPGAIKFEIVQALPTTGIEEDTIYLVPITPDESDNNYAEYIYVNGAWEELGKIGVHVDLSGYQPLIDNEHKLASDLVDDTNQTNKFTTANEKNSWNAKYDKPSGGIPSTDLADDYVKPTDYATNTTGGVIKTSGGSYNLAITSQGLLYVLNNDYATYQSKGDNAFIGKGTLESVITGKGLVSNTDYATSQKTGVIKMSADVGTQGNATTGVMSAMTRTYAQYTSASNNMFIGKGTLENVLNEVVGDISSALDTINGEVV